MVEERQPMNVEEGFPLIDTIQIGPGTLEVEGYAGFSNLAGEEAIPFFTKRTRSNVGLAYTNKDSTDALPFAYKLSSIGLQFVGSPDRIRIPVPEIGGVPTPEDVAEYEGAYLFEKVLPDHVGVTLKVREDERLATVAVLTPPGYGPQGTNTGADLQAPVHALTQSWPDLRGRFKFPEPIRVPRNTIVVVELKFSKWAKALLSCMPGPTSYAMFDVAAHAKKDIPRRALIRCTLIGKREIQQRGELHV